MSSPPGYFALIYADGDSLGRALDDCPNLPAIGTVANTIYQALGAATNEAIAAARLEPGQFDLLLRGGDDLILAVPAQHALPVALTLARVFPQYAAAEPALGQSRSLSIAIVWAHQRFPFGAWLELTESTLAFAKQQGAQRNVTGLLNFLVVSSANHLDFAQFHNEILINEERDAAGRTMQTIRTLRPYTADALESLMHYRIDDDKLRLLPRTRLEALRRAVFHPSSRQSMLDSLRLLIHWRGAPTRDAVISMVQTFGDPSGRMAFPFVARDEPDPAEGQPNVVYRTAIADLAELWDFIPGGTDAARDD